ncbi:MAG: hypothetical protein P1V18_06230 [Candidatus Gracilibacteria bacterium]|nr:hypothetical protein [Candidatus Gracilibacteria bacterium]
METVSIISVLIEDPLWVIGSLGILLLPLVFFGTSLIQNFREEWWFHGALLVVSTVMYYALSVFPFAHEFLIQYRSDWSWMYLLEHLSVWNVITLGLFVMASFAVLSVTLLMCLAVYSLFTLRLDRLVVLFKRYYEYSASLVVYAVSMVSAFILLQIFSGGVLFQDVERFFSFGLLIFGLSFFLKSVDSAVFSQPRSLLRFGLVSTAMIVFSWLMHEIIRSDFTQAFPSKTLFVVSLVGFFVGILFGGYYMVAFIHSRFASGPYVDVWLQQQHAFKRALMYFFVAPEQRTFSAQLMNKAVFINIVVGGSMLHLVSGGNFLLGTCSVFVGYFILFYLLDFQQDMLEKGELVQHRSFSIDRGMEHLMDEWEYHDEIAEISVGG